MDLLGALGSAGIGFLTGGPAGAVAGGLGSLFSSKAPQKRTSQQAAAAQQAQGQLSGVGNQLLQRYQSASPGEQAALNYFFQRAGLGNSGNAQNGVGVGGVSSQFGNHGVAGAHGVGSGTAPGVNGGQPFAAFGSRRTLPGFQAQAAPGAQTGLVGGSLGIYNSPQYQLLRQQAEEGIQHDMQSNQLGFNNTLAGRGIDQSSVQQGGQAAITAGANKSYADFSRQLAMNAADKQDQLVSQYTGASQPALNSAGTAGGLFGAAAGLGQSGQQINQAQGNLQNSLLGGAVNAAANYWGLGKGGGGTADAGVGGDTSGVDQNPNVTAADTAGWKAHGGPVQAGGYPVGANGKPHTTAVPTAMLQQLMDHLVARSAGQSGAPAMAQGGPVQAFGAPHYVAPEAAHTGPAPGRFWDAVNAYFSAGPTAIYDHLLGHPAGGAFLGPHSLNALRMMGEQTYQQAVNGDFTGVDARNPYQPEAPAPDPLIHQAFVNYLATLGAPEMQLPAPLPARAGGGPVGRMPYVVGDGVGPETYLRPGHAPQVIGQNGPTLFRPPANGYVLPNPSQPPVQEANVVWGDGPMQAAGRTPLEQALFAHLMAQKVG